MHLLINAFGANNYSSCVVIRNHILNLNITHPHLRVVVFAVRGSFLVKMLSTSNAICSYVLLPATFLSLSLRFINEFILLPLYSYSYLAKRSALVSFSGYPLWFIPINQIIYFQNPMPYLGKKLIRSTSQALKQFFIFHLTRILSISASSNDLYLFNSRFMMNICKPRLLFLKQPEFKICYNSVIVPSSDVSSPKLFSDFKSELSIISVAPFDRYKNNHLVFAAFVELAQKYSNATFTHIGPVLDKAYYDEIVSFIPKSINSRCNIYTNRVSDLFLENVMKSAFIYCSASTCESFGLPAIESQSYGVPSVIQLNTAAAEVTGKGGIICDFTNRECLKDIIDQFYDFPDAYYSLSLKSLENYKKFSSPSVSDPLASYPAAIKAHR